MRISVKVQEGRLNPGDAISMEFLASIKDGYYHVSFPAGRSKVLTEEVRRVAQNALYWSWLTDISKTKVETYAGSTPEEWAYFFKKKYLIPIFLANPDTYPNFVKSHAVLEELAQTLGNGAIYQSVEKTIVSMTTTTMAKVKHFADYLAQIERFAHRGGIPLRTDRDIFRAAITGKIESEAESSGFGTVEV